MALCLIVAAGCGRADGPFETAVRQAADVWERGVVALEPEPPPEFPRVQELKLCDNYGAFVDFDDRVREFLAYGWVRPAVRFSCVGMASHVEDALTQALGASDSLTRLRALVVLVRVRAPHSVATQWATLQSLRTGPAWRPVAASLTSTDPTVTKPSPRAFAAGDTRLP